MFNPGRRGPVNEAIRDQVRLRMPRTLVAYQRWLRPRITGQRGHVDLAVWTAQGVKLVRELGATAVRFDRDGPWIEDSSGLLWYYGGGLCGTATWAEYGQEYEREETGLLAELLPAGGTMIDVGANVGLHSIKVARQVPQARILAFEPVGATIASLRRNIVKNCVADKVEVHHLALSDHNGELRITNGLQVTNFVVPDEAAAADRATETVPCRRLDDFLDGRTDSVDLIKCDVEGSELGVMRGASRTLQRFKPVIFVEIIERYSRRYGHGSAAVFDYFREHNYSHELIIDGRRRPSTGSLSEDLAASTNFLFVPSRL